MADDNPTNRRVFSVPSAKTITVPEIKASEAMMDVVETLEWFNEKMASLTASGYYRLHDMGRPKGFGES